MAYTPHTWTTGETIDAAKLNANEAGTQAAAAAADAANTAVAGKVNSSTYTAGLAAKADVASLATVATSGAYADLSGKPTIPAALPTQTGNAGKFLTTDGTSPSWGTPAAGGSVSDATTTAKGIVQLAGDLGGTAAAPTVQKINGSTPATVATTGVYADLSGKPSIPTVGAAGAGAGVALSSTDGSVTNPRTPTAHASTHATGGSDPITPASIGAVSTANAVQLAASGQETLTQNPSTTGTAADAGHTHRLPNADGNGDISLYSADGTTIKLHVSGGTVGGSTGGGGSSLTSVYGDGSDGTATISTTVVMSRNLYYTNLTLAAGAILVTGGYGLFVSGTLTIAGTLQCNGLGNGNSSDHGTFGCGSSGGKTGTATTAGANGSALDNPLRFGGTGGAGGTGGGGLAGGVGTAGTTPTLFPRTQTQMLLGAVHNYSGGGIVFTAVTGGVGGGQGGGDGAANAGGNGGGGGGVLPVFARNIVVQGAGQIVCAGGDGAAGTGGNAGGGGGGGGGTVLCICDTYSGAAPTAPGGAGGASAGTGSPGAAGSAGAVYLLKRS